MDSRALAASSSRVRRFRKVISSDDLVNAVNAGVFDVALGTLPPNACVLGHSARLTAYFTGGGATTCTMSIGTAAATADIMTALNVLDTTTLAKALPGTLGVAPRGDVGGGAAVALVARFTPDAGHNLTALTAGSVTVEVMYSVPDERA